MNPPPPSPLLSQTARTGLLLVVILCHVGGVWALTRIAPFTLADEDPPKLQVRFVQPPPPPPQIEVPLPEDTPVPEWLPEPEPQPQLEQAIEGPLPDLPPPVFAKPVPPRPPPPKVLPPQPPPKPPASEKVEALQAAPPSTSRSLLKTVTEAELSYRVPPQPIYPTYALRAREFGTALVDVLIDVSGRPAEVSLAKSSTYGALDREALRCVRSALFEPHLEDGVATPVRVVIPIHFVLLREK
jgi:protein TonB